MGKSITRYSEYIRKKENLDARLVEPPYSYHFSIVNGDLHIANDTVLVPSEALRLGRWLVAFYEGAEDEH